jgi:dTDP-4-amino-4,6-dideoxygalactose transaminase
MTFRPQSYFIFGATPVFIDSEPETWNLCPVALEIAIIDRIAKRKTPKAIAVDLYGVPYKIEEEDDC